MGDNVTTGTCYYQNLIGLFKPTWNLNSMRQLLLSRHSHRPTKRGASSWYCLNPMHIFIYTWRLYHISHYMSPFVDQCSWFNIPYRISYLVSICRSSPMAFKGRSLLTSLRGLKARQEWAIVIQYLRRLLSILHCLRIETHVVLF